MPDDWSEWFGFLPQAPAPGLFQYAAAGGPESIMAAMGAPTRLPPQDELLRARAGQPPPFYPSQPNWGQQRDPFIFGGGGMPQGDVVLPSGAPPFADVTPRIPKSIHRNDARMFDYMPTSAPQDSRYYDETTRRMMELLGIAPR